MNDNNDFSDKLKAKIGKGVKAIGRQIALAFLPIIPYLLLFCFAFLLFLGVYFIVINTSLSYMNQVAEDSATVGQKWGHLASFHGYKTNYEFEKSEQNRFVKTLQKYKEKYDFDDYRIALITQTLLFEGNNEEEIYLSEVDLESIASEIGTDLYNNSELLEKFKDTNYNSSDIVSKIKGLNLSADSIKKYIAAFVKLVPAQFVSNFVGSYFGQSQYEKINKELNKVAIIVNKCNELTNGDFDKFNTCYKGYLVANDDLKTTYYITNKSISPVKTGYLINRFPFSEINEKFMNIAYSILSFNPIAKLLGQCAANLKFKLEVLLFYDLAGENDSYFFYTGYIVDNLKEYYKVESKKQAAISQEKENADKNKYNEKLAFFKPIVDTTLPLAIIKHTIQNVINAFGDFSDFVSISFTAEELEILKKEIDNREVVADTIFWRTKVFYGAKYGQLDLNTVSSGKSVIISTQESSSGISVIINGKKTNISFSDFVKLTLIDLYGLDALKVENTDVLKAMIIHARTVAYQKLGTTSLSGVFDTKLDLTDIYNKYHDNVSDSDNSRLDKLINETIGSVIKDGDGNLKTDVNIDPSQDIGSSSFDDVIDSVGGHVKPVNDVVSPIPGINNLSDYLTSGFSSIDSAHITEHGGVDIGVALGTNVASVTAGRVIAAHNSCGTGSLGNRCGPSGYGGYGNIVVIESVDATGATYYTYYAHMNGGSVTVNVGDMVEPGQIIGQVGSSGSSTGAHLHFEVRYGKNEKSCVVNPLTFYGL